MSLPAPQEDRRSGLLVAVRRRFRQGLVWADFAHKFGRSEDSGTQT